MSLWGVWWLRGRVELGSICVLLAGERAAGELSHGCREPVSFVAVLCGRAWSGVWRLDLCLCLCVCVCLYVCLCVCLHGAFNNDYSTEKYGM